MWLFNDCKVTRSRGALSLRLGEWISNAMAMILALSITIAGGPECALSAMPLEAHAETVSVKTRQSIQSGKKQKGVPLRKKAGKKRKRQQPSNQPLGIPALATLAPSEIHGGATPGTESSPAQTSPSESAAPPLFNSLMLIQANLSDENLCLFFADYVWGGDFICFDFIDDAMTSENISTAELPLFLDTLDGFGFKTLPISDELLQQLENGDSDSVAQALAEILLADKPARTENYASRGKRNKTTDLTFRRREITIAYGGPLKKKLKEFLARALDSVTKRKIKGVPEVSPITPGALNRAANSDPSGLPRLISGGQASSVGLDSLPEETKALIEGETGPGARVQLAGNGDYIVIAGNGDVYRIFSRKEKGEADIPQAETTPIEVPSPQGQVPRVEIVEEESLAVPSVPTRPFVHAPVPGFKYIEPESLKERLLIEELFSRPIPDPRNFVAIRGQYESGPFQLMNGLHHPIKFGSAADLAAATGTIADDWCMMSYRHSYKSTFSFIGTLPEYWVEYHFAYNPERNMVVPHYIKKLP